MQICSGEIIPGKLDFFTLYRKIGNLFIFCLASMCDRDSDPLVQLAHRLIETAVAEPKPAAISGLDGVPDSDLQGCENGAAEFRRRGTKIAEELHRGKAGTGIPGTEHDQARVRGRSIDSPDCTEG